MIVIPPIALSNTEGTYSRSTVANFININGWIEAAGVNTLRTSYDDDNLICKGILIEPAATNLAWPSQDLRTVAEGGTSDNWAQSTDTAVKVMSVSTVLPTSSTAGCSKLAAESLADTTRQITRSFTAADSSYVILSVFVKAAECTHVAIVAGTKNTLYPYALIKAEKGSTPQLFSDGGESILAAGVKAISGSWVRLWVSYNVKTGATSPSFSIKLRNANNTEFTPTSTDDGLFLYGTQIETVNTLEKALIGPTSYIIAASSDTTRTADTFTGTSPCLLYSSVPNTYTTTDWVANTAYAIGAYVKDTTTNCVYRCLRTIGASTPESTVNPDLSSVLTIPYWTKIDAVPWNSGTTYTYTATIPKYVTYQNRTYQLLTTSTNNTPSAVSTYWGDVGPSNRWAPLDLLVNTSSKARFTMDIVIKPNTRVDSIVLFGMTGINSATISVFDPATGITTYSRSNSLVTRIPLGWYDYFFSPMTTKASTVFSEIPPTIDTYICIRLEGTDMELGGMVLGKGTFIGSVQRGATNDVINFSSVTRDTFGNASMVPRRNIPKTNQTLYLDKSLLNVAMSIRDLLNAEPAAWVGLDDVPEEYYFEALLVVGFYKTFSINIDNPIGVIINLELEQI